VSRIAVDAMGGDRAPAEIVGGALDAFRAGHDVVLVGDMEAIGPHLDGARVEVVPATEVIHMDEDPGRAIRDKKDASISVASRLVASGEADGVVSAGSTGAAIAAAAFIIGRVRGITRPAIASLLPTDKVVLDSGANLTCRPDQLVEFAVMGAALATSHFGLDSPKVGLLNIGEEPGKGRELEKAAFDMLSTSPGIHFVGNVEGHDIASSRADVIVTDGFTGNVLLKTAEGTADMVQRILTGIVADDPAHQPALAQLAPAFGRFREILDPESIGGAQLLGVDGVVIIAHGSSSRTAVSNAVAMAVEGAEHKLPSKIKLGVAALAGV
jgi:glycerol-3-phosphate acyltransferase PlsX